MHLHPDIAALRADRGPQRLAQAAMLSAREAWARQPGAEALLRELGDFAAGAPLDTCPQLEAVFTQAGEAERLCLSLSAHFCAALSANPYGQPPFRNGFDGQVASLMVARVGAAQIMLQSREPGSFAYDSYRFSDMLRFDAVVGGQAQARVVRITRAAEESAQFAAESITLGPGCRLALDLTTEALMVERVDQRLVTLRLLRTNDNARPKRDFDAADGTLVMQSAGSIATSRQEAMIALLGRMGRIDAAPAIVAVALGEGDMSLRWQGLREALALDTASGFRALLEVARRSDDPLAGPAGALRAQLIETYPALRQLENAACPA